MLNHAKDCSAEQNRSLSFFNHKDDSRDTCWDFGTLNFVSFYKDKQIQMKATKYRMIYVTFDRFFVLSYVRDFE